MDNMTKHMTFRKPAPNTDILPAAFEVLGECAQCGYKFTPALSNDSLDICEGCKNPEISRVLTFEVSIEYEGENIDPSTLQAHLENALEHVRQENMLTDDIELSANWVTVK
jgi:hypothetical protein